MILLNGRNVIIKVSIQILINEEGLDKKICLYNMRSDMV